MPEASALRILDHKKIDLALDRRIEWRETSRARWKTLNPLNTTLRWPAIVTETRENLHTICEFLNKTTASFKLVVSGNQANVYANSQTFLKQLDSIPALNSKSYKRVKIDLPKNTILIKSSQHRQRSYIRRVRLLGNEKQSIKNFFENQGEHIRISPSLKQWLATPYTWTQDYFFIDYNEESWLTMLSLVRSGLIRKTVQIITGK